MKRATMLPDNMWLRVAINLLVLMIAMAFAVLSFGAARGGSTQPDPPRLVGPPTGVYQVWLPIVSMSNQDYPACSLVGFTNTPGFEFWCNREGMASQGAGWMNLVTSDIGWFNFDGCLPWGNCARLYHDDSNVSWSYINSSAITSVNAGIGPYQAIGPGFFYVSVTPAGNVSGYGCWPWGDCQTGPPINIK